VQVKIEEEEDLSQKYFRTETSLKDEVVKL
jgi:hypothetical protein